MLDFATLSPTYASSLAGGVAREARRGGQSPSVIAPLLEVDTSLMYFAINPRV